MIISTVDELRLFCPANAFDSIDSLTGFISSSEHDFLKDKLGVSLYDALIVYYSLNIRDNVTDYISQIQLDSAIPPYAQLLFLAQKAVTFDALSRAISVQALSVNGAGVNVASAEDYKPADSQAIADFKKACVKEAHSAINEMLQCLEQWAIDAAKGSSDPEADEIVELWKNSRYFYLVASLLIPSATVLQDYYNIYDSREKFIQLIPDLRYIQEDILAPIYGDEFIEYIAAYPLSPHSAPDKHITRITHLLRKVMARHLEARLLKPADPRRDAAYNEAVKLTSRLNDYLQTHQPDFSEPLLEILKTTEFYVDANVEEKPEPKFKNNAPGSVLFITPDLM